MYYYISVSLEKENHIYIDGNERQLGIICENGILIDFVSCRFLKTETEEDKYTNGILSMYEEVMCTF